MYTFFAWLFFSLGAFVRKRTASLFLVFVLGAVASLVQDGLALALVSGAMPPIQSMLGIVAFLIVQLAICSFLAPLVGRPNGYSSSRRP
ncbi:hypothetical protein [Dokdonella soli]|uniref:hypothetical protein n=1 Tax=Dokdonella soli TaxID=529810 RepID=UPI0031E018D5